MSKLIPGVDVIYLRHKSHVLCNWSHKFAEKKKKPGYEFNLPEKILIIPVYAEFVHQSRRSWTHNMSYAILSALICYGFCQFASSNLRENGKCGAYLNGRTLTMNQLLSIIWLFPASFILS